MTADLSTVQSDEGCKYVWGGNCLGWRLLELSHMQVRQEWMPPGGAETPHWHARAHQFFYVLRGSLRLSTPSQELILGPQQGVHVPPGIRHTAANEGSTDVQFLVFSSPSTTGDRFNTTAGFSTTNGPDKGPST